MEAQSEARSASPNDNVFNKLNVGCVRHSSSKLGSALTCTTIRLIRIIRGSHYKAAKLQRIQRISVPSPTYPTKTRKKEETVGRDKRNS